MIPDAARKYVYYEEPGITLLHANCLDVLPLFEPKSVDLVLTDPPYGIGETNEKNLTRGLKASPRNFGKYTWDNKPVNQGLIDIAIDVGKFACVFGGNFYYMKPSSCWLVWDKEINGDFADCELAWTNYNKAVRLKRHMWNGMLRKNNETRYLHPTQKPLEIILWAISLCPNEPHLILDPFLGSGTTAVAAKQLGRKCIGIEIEEKYLDIAIERLRQNVLPL